MSANAEPCGMSVTLHTNYGDIKVELNCEETPRTCPFRVAQRVPSDECSTSAQRRVLDEVEPEMCIDQSTVLNVSQLTLFVSLVQLLSTVTTRSQLYWVGCCRRL